MATLLCTNDSAMYIQGSVATMGTHRKSRVRAVQAQSPVPTLREKADRVGDSMTQRGPKTRNYLRKVKEGNISSYADLGGHFPSFFSGFHPALSPYTSDVSTIHTITPHGSHLTCPGLTHRIHLRGPDVYKFFGPQWVKWTLVGLTAFATGAHSRETSSSSAGYNYPSCGTLLPSRFDQMDREMESSRPLVKDEEIRPPYRLHVHGLKGILVMKTGKTPQGSPTAAPTGSTFPLYQLRRREPTLINTIIQGKLQENKADFNQRRTSIVEALQDLVL
ncbi:hypothetical protein PHLGIDRAFT_10929 [Phlebiopsis gigantea 11061_1 CR5-6]|uniref:Uncharacterized protein n=1 Tax=Phlebiopsis gigantea (strain 11061_1 CR5-6) TaxID=745531 RepID=A0A0C3PTW4_PHLG1|nr:hypothetical protein PHLGIDRAFT_10929 [Phlebiopsis gigantea 11061_1 CR5-6]